MMRPTVEEEQVRDRRWTDPRDGQTWKVVHNPGVELSRPRERALRSKVIFDSGEERHEAPAVFGEDLEALDDDALMGLLDQARESEE